MESTTSALLSTTSLTGIWVFIKNLKVDFTLIISLLSLTISLVVLWRGFLSRFQPITTIGDLRLRIYPIKNGKQRWFIPSLDVPVNIANDAARAGKILGIRIILNFPKLPINDNREIYYPKWEVDPQKFTKLAQYRFHWIDEAAKAEWVPFVILPKTTVTKHIIFETGRWDEPVIQEELVYRMEILTDSNEQWLEIGKWALNLYPELWSELVENGTSIGTRNLISVDIEGESRFPNDLHKYTGTKKKIPKGGFKAKPSYQVFTKRDK